MIRGARPAVLVLVGLFACKRTTLTTGDASAAEALPPIAAAATAGADASSASTSAPAVGASPASGHTVDGGSSAPCVQPALQPGTCVPSGVFPLDDRASLRWLEVHGARAASDAGPVKLPGLVGCREVSFGPAKESVLVCDEVDVTHVDAKLGLDGPAQTRNALRIITVRDGRLATLVRVPISVGSSESDELFRASFVIDEDAGALDVVVAATDCTNAQSRLDAFWDEHIAAMKSRVPDAKTRGELAGAMTSERKAGGPRIAEICAARGHYVLVDGRLVKQP